MRKIEDRDIDFVAKHYRRGAFSPERAWHNMGFSVRKNWKPIRIAASIVAIVAVTAVASVIIHNEYAVKEEATETIVEQSAPTADLKAVKVIDFDNAPLPVVVEEIKKVYGVEVSGLPSDSTSYHLTLHYEGNVVDLIDTINEILDTKLTVKE